MPANNPWEQKLPRRHAATQERRRVLIVCEDSKSACDYFKAFAIDPMRAEVFPVGTGMNTDSLVEKAMEFKTKAAGARQPYNEVWRSAWKGHP